MAARGPAMPSSFQPEEKGQPPSLGDISEKFHAAPWLTFFWPVWSYMATSSWTGGWGMKPTLSCTEEEEEWLVRHREQPPPSPHVVPAQHLRLPKIRWSQRRQLGQGAGVGAGRFPRDDIWHEELFRQRRGRDHLRVEEWWGVERTGPDLECRAGELGLRLKNRSHWRISVRTSSSAFEEVCLAVEAGGAVSPEKSGKEGGASEQMEETREAAVTWRTLC